MQVETRTKMRVSPTGPELILYITLLPRGSGNRAAVRRLGAAARRSEMAPHIKRMVCGATRLTIYLRSSLALMKTIMTWTDQELGKSKDVPGQMPLFGAVR